MNIWTAVTTIVVVSVVCATLYACNMTDPIVAQASKECTDKGGLYSKYSGPSNNVASCVIPVPMVPTHR